MDLLQCMKLNKYYVFLKAFESITFGLYEIEQQTHFY